MCTVCNLTLIYIFLFKVQQFDVVKDWEIITEYGVSSRFVYIMIMDDF